MYVGGGSEQVVLEDGVVLLTQSSEHKGDRAIPQFNVTRLAHDTVSIGDGEVREL